MRAPSMTNAAATRKCRTIAVFTALALVSRLSAIGSTDTLSVARLNTRSSCASAMTISGIHEARASASASAAAAGTGCATGSAARRAVISRVTRQRAGREEREQREAGQREERDLERREPRLGVDAHRLHGLLVGGGRGRERGDQAIVADERHLVEVELGLQLIRDPRVVDELAVHAGAEDADDERGRDRRADAGREIVRAAAERSDVARELLRRGRDEHVEEQRDQGALAEAGERHAGDHHAGAPIVADHRGEEGERDRRDEEGAARDGPRAREAIKPDDEDGRS